VDARRADRQARDIYYPRPATTPPPTARSTDRRNNTETDYTVGAYIGGPLIEDTLFMFLSGEKLISNRGTAGSVNDGTWTKSDNTNDRYLAKFDWNITNDHHLELSLVGDRYYSTEKLSTYDYATGTHSSDYGGGPLHQHRWHQRRRGCGLPDPEVHRLLDGRPDRHGPVWSEQDASPQHLQWCGPATSVRCL
jgi:hypothetical protein